MMVLLLPEPTTPTTRPTTTTAIPDYPVRTKDGVQIILVTQQKDYFRGPVQIFDNKQWLGICDHGWSYPEAKVVCRQFGYQGSQSAHRFRKYEIGNIGGSIRIRCSGSERQLHDCYVVSSAEPCLSLYAGVTCYSESLSYLLIDDYDYNSGIIVVATRASVKHPNPNKRPSGHPNLLG